MASRTVPPTRLCVSPPSGDDIRRGILSMLAAVLGFAILNVLVKVLAETYPVAEVTFFRNAFAILPVGVMVAIQGGLPLLRTARLRGHFWRASIGLTSMTLMFWSYDLLPLADAVALGFTAPLFLTALSVPLLGEKVGIHRWSAVVVGFAGVVVMVRPDGDVVQAGAIVALGSAVAYALAMVAIRQLSRSEAALTIVFYFTVLSTGLSALALPFCWVTPAPLDFLMMAATGLVGGVAQFFLTRAYGLAPAAVVAPFNYLALLFATLFGWMIWGDLPGWHVALGAVIVVASGLYILHRETARKAPVVQAARPPAPEGGD